MIQTILVSALVWTNVLHFTTGGNNGNYGDRTPGIWLYGGEYPRMFVASAISGNKNKYKDLTTIHPWKWYSIEISQMKKKHKYDKNYGKVLTKFKSNINNDNLTILVHFLCQNKWEKILGDRKYRGKSI